MDNKTIRTVFKSFGFSKSMEKNDDFGAIIKDFISDDTSINDFENTFFSIAPYLQKTIHIFTEDKIINSSTSNLGIMFKFELLLKFLKSKQLQKLEKLTLTDMFISKIQLNQLLHQLTKIKSLTLEKCRLDNLSDIFGDGNTHFPELIELNLNGNYIREFSIDPTHFPLLSVLDLSFNALIGINFNDYNCGIKILHLQENNFTEFPKEILCLRNLEELNLSNNKLEILPPEIEKMQSLLVLNLSKNRLRELPINLTKLTYLSKLCLAQNYISKLPALKPMSSLEELDISDNRINYLFNDLAILEGCNLIKLDASSNDISAISHLYTVNINTTSNVGKSFLSTLRYLKLTHNRIANITFLAGAISLVELDISHNSLTTFNQAGNNEFTCLENINLSYNNLCMLINGLFNIITLKKLDLSHNNITKLDNIENLIYLEHLNVSNNKITSFPQPIQNREYLKVINAKNNNIKDIPTFFKEMASLTYFDVDNNPIDEKNPNNLEMIAYIHDLHGGNDTNVYTSRTTHYETINDEQTGVKRQAQVVDNYINQNRISKEKMDEFRKADENDDDISNIDLHAKHFPRQNTPIRMDDTIHNKYFSNLEDKIINHYAKRNDIIIIKENYINAIRDFIIAYPHSLSLENLEATLKNINYFKDETKRTLICSCGDRRLIDGIGKNFLQILQHVFFYVVNQEPFRMEKLIKNIKFHVEYHTNTKTPNVPKYIECIINAMNGMCDEITNNVSDIEKNSL